LVAGASPPFFSAALARSRAAVRSGDFDREPIFRVDFRASGLSAP
jgi:hypothetical protein